MNEITIGWMNEWTNEWMNEWMNERNERTNERMNEWKNEWMNEWNISWICYTTLLLVKISFWKEQENHNNIYTCTV